MISFSCSHCGLKLKVKPEFAGRSSKCPTCKKPLVVPSPDRTEGHVPVGQIDGTASSVHQAGVEGGVTLGQKSVQELLARNKKGQRYIIQNEIARGGMGAVLLAIDSDLRREVAVKFMLDHADAKKKLRFIEEAQITGQLEHPNIPPVHELGLDAQKRLFFSMKMVRGKSLKEVVDMLRENPKEAEKEYTLGRLLNIFVNVCNGLAYAHSRGVVHRDLKPANIMTGDFGEVYVMDWGLAKVLKADGQVAAAPMATVASDVSSSAPSAVSVSSSSSKPSSKVVTSREPEADLTQEGAIVGTPVYMPPEQAMGEIGEIDQRSDIYSLGAILYEMLTLVPPIEKEGGYLNILMRVSEGAITPPEVRVGQSSGIMTDTSQSSGTRLLSGLKSKLKQAMVETASKLRGTTKPTVPWHIPAELSAVAMKALAKEKKDRYQSVEDLRRDIERFQEGRSVSAKEDTKKEMLWKFVKRNKGFSAASFLGFMVACVILYFSFKINFQARLHAEEQRDEAKRNYVAYQKEQEERRAQGKKAVPAFVDAARLSVERKKLDAAMAQVDVALGFDEDYADACLLKGQLLIAQKDFAAARKELDKYLKHKPGDADAKILVELCRTSRPDDTAGLMKFAEVFLRQKVPSLAENFISSRDKMLPIYQQRIEAAWPGLGVRLTIDQDGKYTLNFDSCKQVVQLEPLKGIPLHILNLQGCADVRDLSPLKDMPLTSLAINFTQVKDLSPLRGIKLTMLNLASCALVSDLTPLQGMPLTNLNLMGCSGIRDLNPLRGMPLTNLDLYNCHQLKDVSPLQGMPLTNLSLSHCALVASLLPLKGMKLTKLNLRNCPQVKDLSPLEGMPLTDLDLYGCSQIKGLSPLQGMKLTRLVLVECAQVNDLSPLQKMPLTSLDLSRSVQVADLTPLKGMKLTSLGLTYCTQVRDVTPLQGMPLTRLDLDGTLVEDLTPLQGTTLTHIALNPKVIKKGMDVLRQMKSLKNISDGSKLHLPSEFWKKYDAGEFNK